MANSVVPMAKVATVNVRRGKKGMAKTVKLRCDSAATNAASSGPLGNELHSSPH